MLVFVLFYGLDWIATVPPTIALCRERFGDAGPVVFGWVFASHQVGAAVAAAGAGVIHDRLGAYDTASSAHTLAARFVSAEPLPGLSQRRLDAAGVERQISQPFSRGMGDRRSSSAGPESPVSEATGSGRSSGSSDGVKKRAYCRAVS